MQVSCVLSGYRVPSCICFQRRNLREDDQEEGGECLQYTADEVHIIILNYN